MQNLSQQYIDEHQNSDEHQNEDHNNNCETPENNAFGYHLKFQQHLLKISQSKSWSIAKQEWEPTGLVIGGTDFPHDPLSN